MSSTVSAPLPPPPSSSAGYGTSSSSMLPQGASDDYLTQTSSTPAGMSGQPFDHRGNSSTDLVRGGATCSICALHEKDMEIHKSENDRLRNLAKYLLSLCQDSGREEVKDGFHLEFIQQMIGR